MEPPKQKQCIMESIKLEAQIVKTISTEIIKPSSTFTPITRITPYKFCLLDQFFGLTYVPQVLFYNNNTQETFINQLKHSLSKALSLYYPLAGRLCKTDDRSTIDCNDQGVTFVNAQIDSSLNDFLLCPARVDLVTLFLPAIRITDEENRALDASELDLLAIQVTKFNCGGIAIGSQYLHKVFDGASWSNFLRTWAAFTARDDGDVVMPDFTTANMVYPPCKQVAAASSMSQRRLPLTARSLGGADDDNGSGTCVGKAFIFTANSITTLQAKGTSEQVPNPTRVEALSGFIWKYAIAASASASASASDHALNSITMSGESVLIHSVNMRPRTNPPLPSTAMGNLITHAIAHCNGPIQGAQKTKPNTELPELVGQVRKSLSEAKDSYFLSKFQGDKGVDAVRTFKQKLAGINSDPSVSTYKFTSWSKLDVFPDFGFGSPVWFGFVGGRLSSNLRNLVVLAENPKRQEIEAWLILDEHEMAFLESNIDFLEFAKPTV